MRDAGHILGLDAWRAALLLAGVLLHGSIGLPETPLFAAMDIVSQTFRMGSFFAIAGTLSAVAIARRDPDVWVRRRLVRLGIPLAAAMAVIPPLIWLMAQGFGWTPPAPPLMFDWYHLWFLVALTLYSLILHRLVRWRVDVLVESRIAAWSDSGRPTASIAILVTACASATLFAAMPIAMDWLLSPRLFVAYRNLQLIAGYLPMFLLGVLVVRVPAFGARVLAEWRSAAVIVVLVAAGFIGWFCLVAPRVALADTADAAVVTANLRFIAGALCPPAAFVLILRSALAIRRVPVAFVRLSEASYTIYLLHLPIALAINLSLTAMGVATHASYGLAVLGSGAFSYLFHRTCVRRSDTLKLLLNGQTTRTLPARSYASDRL